MPKENASKILLDELESLRKQLRKIKEEKEQLEITLEMITDHADLMEADYLNASGQLQHEVAEREQTLAELRKLIQADRDGKNQLVEELTHLRKQLQTLAKKKKSLEISLETITEHADAFEDELVKSQETLERKVAERTKELKEKNRLLQAEIGERMRIELELRQARDAAEQARVAAEASNRAKSIFLTKMSHELRTPLNAIIGYSEMLREDAEDIGCGDAVDDLEAIFAAGKHLLTIVNDVLDISRIESDNIALQPVNFDIRELVQNVAGMFRPALRDNTLRVDCDPAIGLLHNDKTRVQQVLQNLMSNAVRFTCKGEIHIRASRQERHVQFVVADTGIGIAQDKLECIFDAFTQADESFTRKYDGMGLGLTICKELCRLMGGSIQVNSELGKGSTFTVQLPDILSVAASPGESA